MINYSIAIMGTKPGTKKEQITETKAYGSAQVNEVLDLNRFAKHITDHGCAYDRGDVIAILVKAVDCLREMMLAGEIDGSVLMLFAQVLVYAGSIFGVKIYIKDIIRNEENKKIRNITILYPNNRHCLQLLLLRD